MSRGLSKPLRSISTLLLRGPRCIRSASLSFVPAPLFILPKHTFSTSSKMSDSPPKTSHYPNTALTASKLFDVSFVTAVVTGGGTGIGLMIVQALQSNGATVYITGRRKEALDSVVSQYSTGPGRIIALPGDITQKDECLRLADEVGKLHPEGIHALVNNAGIARDDNTKFAANGTPDMTSADGISQHLLRSEPQQWAETFETNVTAQYFMSAAFIPLLVKGTENTEGYSSCITNISSISGLMKGSSGGQFAYASSKASLVHLTRMLATTLMDVKVRVNQVRRNHAHCETAMARRYTRL